MFWNFGGDFLGIFGEFFREFFENPMGLIGNYNGIIEIDLYVKILILSRFCLNARKKEGGRISILRSARGKLIALIKSDRNFCFFQNQNKFLDLKMESKPR